MLYTLVLSLIFVNRNEAAACNTEAATFLRELQVTQ
jgi:hypothetical protein